MIEACSKIYRPQHIATIQADTFRERIERAFTAQAEVTDQRLVKTLSALHLISQQNSSLALMQDETFKGLCYLCGKPGHLIKNCPEPAESCC